MYSGTYTIVNLCVVQLLCTNSIFMSEFNCNMSFTSKELVFRIYVDQGSLEVHVQK